MSHHGDWRSSVLAFLCACAAACGGGEERDVQQSPAPAPATAAAPAGDEPASGFSRRAWLVGQTFEHDFGSVYPQSLQHASFTCEAAGEEPLVVSSLKYSCGCTAGELYVLDESGAASPAELGRAYPRGTRFRLDTTLNTKGRTGAQEQRITIVCGDGSIDQFTMRATIQPFLIAEPTSIVLDDVDPFQGASAEVVLTAQNGESFHPTLWRKIQGDALSVELVPDALGDDGRSPRWVASLHLAPGLAGETLHPKLIFHADVPNMEAAPEKDGSPAMQRAEVIVVAKIRPVVRAWPEQVNVGRMHAEPVTKQVVLHSDDPEIDFSRARVSVTDALGHEFSEPQACSVTLVPRESSTELGLNLEIRPLSRSGPFAGQIVVELDHPLQARVAIPFQGSMP